jgi:hypothetical protein
MLENRPLGEQHSILFRLVVEHLLMQVSVDGVRRLPKHSGRGTGHCE